MLSHFKKIIPFVFDKRLFVGLFLSYIVLAIVLTFTHECGHYIVARYLGYKVSINYGETHWTYYDTDSIYFKEKSYLKRTWLKDSSYISNNKDFPGKKEYEVRRDIFYKKYYGEKYWSDNNLMTWGGPIETVLTGTIGLFLLFLNRRKIRNAEKLNLRQWLWVFLALFWVRQPTNMVTWLFSYCILGKIYSRMDELRLAGYLHLPGGIITIGSGILGLVVLNIILFYFIPIKQRLTFIMGSFAGGVIGYIFWLILVGPKIMP